MACVGDASKQNTFFKKTVLPKCTHASNVYSRPWWCYVWPQIFADSTNLKLPSKTDLDITWFKKRLMTYGFTSVGFLCKKLHFNLLLRKPFSKIIKNAELSYKNCESAKHFFLKIISFTSARFDWKLKFALPVVPNESSLESKFLELFMLPTVEMRWNEKWVRKTFFLENYFIH